jgi:hypothetical protein
MGPSNSEDQQEWCIAAAELGEGIAAEHFSVSEKIPVSTEMNVVFHKY